MKPTHNKNGEVIPPKYVWIYRMLSNGKCFEQVRPLRRSKSWRLIGKYKLVQKK